MDWKRIDWKSLAIVGAPRTGKTALGYDISDNYDIPKYIFLHPKPKEIEKLGFKQCYGEYELENLNDCLLWMDEPQLYIELYDRRGNRTLRRILSICAQRNVKIIISTNDTRFITRGLESYIECWCIKDIDFDLIKQGSMIKKIIQKSSFVSPRGFKLDTNEYIFYSKNFRQYNGKHTFKEPAYFNETLSKPYRESKLPTKTPTKSEKNE